MQDLDWYLDLSGKKSGPFAVEDIIARYKNGEIPTSAYVTAQRMKGEWVRITDLAEAYRDLFQLNDGPSIASHASLSNIPPAPQTRTNIPRPTPTPQSSDRAPMPSVSELTSPKTARPSSHSSSDRFQAPPRPTEQLEASKLITLNPPGSGSTNTDATEALFQAIQAIREKNQMKTHPPAKDSWGELSRPKGPAPAQSFLYLVLIGILITAAYATYKIVESRNEDQQKKLIAEQNPSPAPVQKPTPPPASSGKLLNDPSSGGSKYQPARTQKLNSAAGGGIHLSTPPKRVDEEEREVAPPPEAEENHDEPEEIEEPNLSPGNSPQRGAPGSDGSYPVDEGADEDAGDGGSNRQRAPINEMAIDPATGLPMNPQNE